MATKMFRRQSVLITTTLSPLIRRRSLAVAASLWSRNVATEEETILVKPSSPTPSHLTKFKLSLIDNHMPPCYMPFIFFYNTNNPAPAVGHSSTGSKSGEGERFDVLKSSLARALTCFYPLAGRLSSDEDSSPVVHCNDEGVPFSFATVANGGESLESFLINRGSETDSLQQFLPFPTFLITERARIESAPQIAIKATVFPCGGVAIGVCLLHKIVDTHTVADFMRLWAAVARGSEVAAHGGGVCGHDRAATLLFPAYGDDVSPSTADFVDKGGGKKSVTKRFVFDEEAISVLKVRARSERVPNPTRSEVVSGLLWKCAMNATAIASSPDGVKPRPVYSVAGMTVDLRYRMKEPWADYSVGNMIWDPIASYENDYKQLYSWDTETKTLQTLVYKLRSSIEKVDVEFIKRLEGGYGREEHTRNEEMRRKMMAAGARNGSKVLHFVASSVIRLGLYDVDFGWGKPVWVSMAKFADHISNIVALMDLSTGYGVEAWMALYEQEMTLLEHDLEFLTYVKNNPN